MTRKYRTAFYPGSFNPFTTGHESIVARTLKLCDRIVIAIGINADKPQDNVCNNMEEIKRLYADDERVKVTTYTGLTVDAARREDADFIIRGIRGVSDYEYERNLAEINLRISGIETLLMPALPELSMVSSSMVRELAHYGYDVTQFKPAIKQKFI